jgi:CRISPR-associated endonuclease/helicase Cas3
MVESTASKRNAARRRLASALGIEPPDTPFPWQLTLLDRFLEERSPSAIDVPTGLGKTAVMAIWLVARAAGANLPRRLVYVVDRRAVVDQATKVAEYLREMVDGDAELKLALGIDDHLAISTLRGKHLDNRRWLEDPSAPAIILGTIDMIGSRLLFEGYGVSRGMRPYHAGLLGADSLIVLDEAHLVPPFERLIETLASGRDGGGRSLRSEEALKKIVPALSFLSLSATGRSRSDALVLSDADRDHPVVACRLRAKKRLSLREAVNERELPGRLAEEMWALSGEGTKPMRGIVFCNRREDALKVQTELKKLGGGQIEVELFVGGRRIFEREQAALWLDEHGFLAGSRAKPQRATFVIATSAGEVGVDLDADHMVCDLVAWERMVQRLGRVNRRGKGDATVMIVPAAGDKPEVTRRLDAVQKLLYELPRTKDTSIDASPGALTDLKARCASDPALSSLVEEASTPSPLHPALTRPTIEAWSMTSLEEHTGRPEVAPWIRGWVEDDEPQTTIAWRKYLPLNDEGPLLSSGDLEVFREAADPHLAERLESETFRVAEWLRARIETVEGSEESEVLDPTERPLRKKDVAAIILDEPSGPRSLTINDLLKMDKPHFEGVLKNRLLLLDVRLGGLDAGLLSVNSNCASDVTLIDGQARVVPFRVRHITGSEETSPDWRAEARIAVRQTEDEETAWLLIESLASEPAESEEGRSGSAKREQKLIEHEMWAEDEARRIAERIALPQPYIEMLAVAARLHDEGKRAKCWQEAFRAPPADVYAKTLSRPSLKRLGGYRHELGSLPYAEVHALVHALEEPLRDLCLHLIAAHHGHARPWLRIDNAEEPPSRLKERSQEVALRFTRLEQRWGPWGLAWWEALLRAADQQASRKNDLKGNGHG